MLKYSSEDSATSPSLSPPPRCTGTLSSVHSSLPLSGSSVDSKGPIWSVFFFLSSLKSSPFFLTFLVIETRGKLISNRSRKSFSRFSLQEPPPPPPNSDYGRRVQKGLQRSHPFSPLPSLFSTNRVFFSFPLCRKLPVSLFLLKLKTNPDGFFLWSDSS